jgi:hypothetical protein
MERTKYIHKYHSRFIPKGIAEVSQIFHQDANILTKLFSYEKYCRGKLIAVWSQSISGKCY